MLALLINVLIVILVVGLFWYVAKVIARKAGAGEPIPVIIDVIFAIIALVGLLNIVGWGGRIVVL